MAEKGQHRGGKNTDANTCNQCGGMPFAACRPCTVGGEPEPKTHERPDREQAADLDSDSVTQGPQAMRNPPTYSLHQLHSLHHVRDHPLPIAATCDLRSAWTRRSSPWTVLSVTTPTHSHRSGG